MKRLFAFAALCLPLYLFAQGFGSFSHDQPFFALSLSNGGPCDCGAGDSPTNVAGLKLWLKADAKVYKDGGTVLCAEGDTVGEWKDSSTNGYILYRGAGAPKYRTNQINGVASVNFTNGSIANTLGGGYNGGITIFCVFKLLPGNTKWVYSGYNSPGYNRGLLSIGLSPYSLEASDMQGMSLPIQTPFTNHSWIMTAICYDDNGWARTNCPIIATHDTNPNNNFNGVTLAASMSNDQYGTVNIAEYILYYARLSDGDTCKVISYLKTKYGL